ncbi:MAG: hypothetical protein C3F07_05555 [Anaerolineales bacterium]|nr:hypothetical protein [Anaerolineae bacterium]PWB75795.1 MAG: hypothetical protein C3F07_05555 [Anaerolineales bacterium]
MNIKEIIQNIRNSLSPHKELSNEAVLGFLRVLENVREEDASCTEIYSKLDEYVECEVDKKDAARLMPLIREHLDICHECCEEYEALLDVLNEKEKK